MSEYRLAQIDTIIDIYEKVKSTVIAPELLLRYAEDPSKLDEIAQKHIHLKKEILYSDELASDIKIIYLDEIENSLQRIALISSQREKVGISKENVLPVLLLTYGIGLASGWVAKAKVDEFLEKNFDRVSKLTIKELFEAMQKEGIDLQGLIEQKLMEGKKDG